MLRSSEHLSSSYLVDFIPRSGRVLVQIVYENMYERFDGRVETPGTLRDLMVRWSQDIGRTIDYLETRADFDASKVAYYALSGGAIWGVVLTAIEERFAASILLGGGLVPVPYRREMHPALFAPRSRTPTLMINGRDDFLMPYDMSQRALFTLLGTPSDRKRHALLDGGHIPTDRREVMREVLDWLDAQLGPVRRTTSVARATQTP
jgi:pimeloyl-ACP methyl ester carboxylesterase